MHTRFRIVAVLAGATRRWGGRNIYMLPVFHVLVLGGRFMGAQSLQLWSSLCDAMDCSLPGSPVHRIFQARILEQVVFPTPGDLPDLGIKFASLCLLRWQVDSLPQVPPGSRVFIKMPTQGNLLVVQ